MDASRFWSKVDKSGDCWLWVAGRNPKGYGTFGGGSRCALRGLAHRLAYTMEVGPIPAGMNVLHACDNPPCVNPAHLSLGTQAENMADMVAKGRSRKARGERAGKAKLTVEAVREIRRLAASGMKNPPIARLYGLNASSVWSIVRRHHWAHVPD